MRQKQTHHRPIRSTDRTTTTTTATATAYGDKKIESNSRWVEAWCVRYILRWGRMMAARSAALREGPECVLRLSIGEFTWLWVSAVMRGFFRFYSQSLFYWIDVRVCFRFGLIRIYSIFLWINYSRSIERWAAVLSIRNRTLVAFRSAQHCLDLHYELHKSTHTHAHKCIKVLYITNTKMSDFKSTQHQINFNNCFRQNLPLAPG